MKEQTAWDRLRTQFKPDGKGRYKTTDAMKVAVQIDKERLQLLEDLRSHGSGSTADMIKKIRGLEEEVAAYKSHLRSVTALNNK
jgi:DNA-directed RNA polymerase alpha subunit